jgi:KUP system potassium uptake protein
MPTWDISGGGRFNWPGLSVVLPALLLNYFGQGALLLRDPQSIVNPFYLLAPAWLLYPMVALATTATVIASQAVISGAFSMTQQAIQLGFSPRMEISHTSDQQIGQIYLPGINWTLLAAVVALVVGFGSSSNLAAAYGIAVTGTMFITNLLAFFVARYVWGWSFWRALLGALPFAIIDLAFFSANSVKIADGGWFPLVVWCRDLSPALDLEARPRPAQCPPGRGGGRYPELHRRGSEG